MTQRRVCRIRSSKTGEVLARLCYEIGRHNDDEGQVSDMGSMESRITRQLEELLAKSPHHRREDVTLVLTSYDPVVDGEWVCPD